MSEEEQQRLLTLLAQARTAMLLLAKDSAMDTDLWHRYLATPVAKIGDVLLENENWQGWQEGASYDTRK
jgi:hypothetical protein